MILLLVAIHESRPGHVSLQLRGKDLCGGATEPELDVANKATDALSMLSGGTTVMDTRITRDREPNTAEN